MIALRWLVAVAALVVLLVSLLVARVNRTLGAPYMDELFHVDQALAYCHGRYAHWNNKLTTLPGLYIVTVAFVKMVPPLGCSLASLRVAQALLGALLFFMLWRLRSDINARESGVRLLLLAAGDWLCPTVFFYNFVFYTDSGSTLCVLLCYWLAMWRRRHAAAAVGALAVLFRQTNIVWMALIGVWCVLADRAHEQPNVALWRFVCRSFGTLLRRYWLWLGVALAFVAFVLRNGSIVLGDRSNHTVSRHYAQMCYLMLFVAPHLLVAHFQWPLFASVWRGARAWLLWAAVTLLAAAALRYGSEPHRFTLADNRHYVFYVWKRVLDRNGVDGRVWFAIPTTLATAHIVALLRANAMSKAWIAALLAFSAVALIPSPLLEPRYFAIPLLMMRLYARPAASTTRLALETLLMALASAAVLYIFLERPFEQNGATQRFLF